MREVLSKKNKFCIDYQQGVDENDGDHDDGHDGDYDDDQSNGHHYHGDMDDDPSNENVLSLFLVVFACFAAVKWSHHCYA